MIIAEQKPLEEIARMVPPDARSVPVKLRHDA